MSKYYSYKCSSLGSYKESSSWTVVCFRDESVVEAAWRMLHEANLWLRTHNVGSLLGYQRRIDRDSPTSRCASDS